MFLTPVEIQRITRRSQKAAQCRVLKDLGYVFEHDAAGWPLVLRSTVEKRHAAANDTLAARGPDAAALAAKMARR